MGKTCSKTTASKERYRVVLTWYGEDHIFFTYATSADNALKNAIYSMAKKFKMLPARFLRYFDGNRENYSVLKVLDNS